MLLKGHHQLLTLKEVSSQVLTPVSTYHLPCPRDYKNNLSLSQSLSTNSFVPFLNSWAKVTLPGVWWTIQNRKPNKCLLNQWLLDFAGFASRLGFRMFWTMSNMEGLMLQEFSQTGISPCLDELYSLLWSLHSGWEGSLRANILAHITFPTLTF